MSPTDRHRTTPQKLVETGFCVLAWLALVNMAYIILGMYLEIYGPTLMDLKIKLHANYEEVTTGVLGRTVGWFPGSVLGGLLVDKYGGLCHLFVALSLVIAGAVTAPIPLLPSVGFLWPMCFIAGIVEAIINVAGQRIVLNIWKEKSASPMILMHSGYGVGSLLVPLYANPFLAVEMPTAINATNMSSTAAYTTTTLIKNDTEQPVKYSEESRIEYTYLISAIPVAMLSLAFFVYQVIESRFMRSGAYNVNNEAVSRVSKDTGEDPANMFGARSFREMVDPATCAAGHRWYAMQLWFLIFFYFGNAGGGERLIGGFLRSYAVDQLEFEKTAASLINTCFWVSFLLGRFSFFVLARWISIRIIILIESGTVLGVAILLNIFARNSSLALWLLIQPLGFFLAPLWPSGVSWTDFHMELTGLGMMMIIIGGSVGGTCHQKLIGYLYEHKGAQTFLYQIAGYGALAFSLCVALNLVGSQHGNRFQWKKSKDESNEEMLTVSGNSRGVLKQDNSAICNLKGGEIK